MFGSYIMPSRTSETSYNNKIFNMPMPENRTIIGDNTQVGKKNIRASLYVACIYCHTCDIVAT